MTQLLTPVRDVLGSVDPTDRLGPKSHPGLTRQWREPPLERRALPARHERPLDHQAGRQELALPAGRTNELHANGHPAP
jgi:hypothetical protein